MLNYANLRLELFEPSLFVILFTAPFVSLLLLRQHIKPWETRSRRMWATIAVWLLAGSISWGITRQPMAIAIAFLGMGVTFLLKKPLKDFFVTGQISSAVALLSPIFGMGWSITFILGLDLPVFTQNIMLLMLGIGLVTLALDLAMLLPSQAYLHRRNWKRPRFSLQPEPRTHYPKVSIHVPCYSEPPAIVCETLKLLNQLKYPNYEVVVVDNNTTDPTLWMPVQQYCKTLGETFRFFHVENLPGAKGGALNYALKRTHQDAELIAIVDADYHAKPEFLERLVGFFDDPKLGFVQTPHDYRGWEGNFYQQACHWEYLLYFKIHLACVNEWMASHIAGTMCVIRREALEKAGGWAEWSLTEDSESAIRIHALGYHSIFVQESFGRGLIPENYDRLRAQRMRWLMGPPQQLKHHWRLLWSIGRKSHLTPWQRVIETVHSLDGLRPLLTILMLPLTIFTTISLIVNQEVVVIPIVMWTLLLVSLPVKIAQQWLTFSLMGCKSFKAILGALMVTASFGYARYLACFKIVFAFKSISWIRTSKFKVLPDRWQALQTTMPEIALAAIHFAIAFLIGAHASFQSLDIVLLSAIAFFFQGCAFLLAPCLALLAEQQLENTPLLTLPVNALTK